MSANVDAQLVRIHQLVDTLDALALALAVQFAKERLNRLSRVDGEIRPLDVSQYGGDNAARAAALNAEGVKRYLLGRPGYGAFETLADALTTGANCEARH